jgi:uncharacterized protein YndB with AHSA1/START domain
MNTTPFTIERTLNAPVSKVWEAISDNSKMKQWYFNIETFKPEVGFEFQFWGESADRKYLHLCKITEVIKEKKLSHTWTYKDYPGESIVTWELFPEGNKTRVVLTHSGLETFPQDSPDFKKESFAQGWTHIVGTSLKEFVEERHNK